MRIGLLGDTHGDFGWMRYCVGMFAREGIDTVIQLGDLGIWPRSSKQFDDFNDYLESAGQTWLVVPGNHEDYDQIEQILPNREGFLPYRSRILLMPRGFRFELDGMSFVALGGAGSVDRARRKSGGAQKSWWEQEAVTQDDVLAVAEGGYADVMLGHDAPKNVEAIESRIKDNSWIAPADLIYAEGIRELVDRAFHSVAPRFYFHGHYHFRVREDKWVHRGESNEPAVSTIVGFGCNPSPYSTEWRYAAGWLDTDTRSVGHFDLKEDFHRNRWNLEIDEEGRW